jgi:uncharacterized protein YbaR (Trm112 family)
MSASSVSPELLEILVCPENKQPVALASPQVLESVNAKIRAGTLRNRGGQLVGQELREALVREDGRVLYPVDDGIPVMLVEESIELYPTAATARTRAS